VVALPRIIVKRWPDACWIMLCPRVPWQQGLESLNPERCRRRR